MEWPECDEGDAAVLELNPSVDDDALGGGRARRVEVLAWEVFALFYWRTPNIERAAQTSDKLSTVGIVI